MTTRMDILGRQLATDPATWEWRGGVLWTDTSYPDRHSFDAVTTLEELRALLAVARAVETVRLADKERYGSREEDMQRFSRAMDEMFAALGRLEAPR